MPVRELRLRAVASASAMPLDALAGWAPDPYSPGFAHILTIAKTSPHGLAASFLDPSDPPGSGGARTP